MVIKMSVAIREINVQHLGPLSRQTFELGKFNLIYGRNENGKTFLVEFLIRSLFRNAKQWRLRSETGIGTVRVVGLEDDRCVDFSPLDKNKLDDYWEKSNVGLPPDFSKLLVVKGAEVDIANVDGGIDKTVLKQLLSGKQILDLVQKKISKTIQEATFDNGLITGARRGEISARTELAEKLTGLERLFRKIDRHYSGGRRKSLHLQKHAIDKDIEQLSLAKKHLAFQLNEEISRLRQDLQKLNIQTIRDIRQNLTLLKRLETQFSTKEEQQLEAHARSEHYEWLKEAQSIYQRLLERNLEKPKPIFIWLAGLFAVAAGTLPFFYFRPLVIVATLFVAMLLAALYVWSFRKRLEQSLENKELENLRLVYKEKFSHELTGLAEISSQLKKLEEDYNSARLLKKQLADEEKQIADLRLKIAEQIKTATGSEVAPEYWEKTLNDIESNRSELDNKIDEKKLRLAALGVDASDYEPTSPGTAYSKQQLDRYIEERDRIEEELKTEDQELATLKQLICQETTDDISVSWEDLIKHLQEKRDTVLQDYKKSTAEIVGKLAVLHALNALRKDEDRKMLEMLQLEAFQKPLFQVTHRYHSLSFEGEHIIVSDAHNRFYLRELSTGAQEQVLLALRIGISATLMKKEHLFLILDDAFQYSDWQLRKLLVDTIAQLAQSGWQIIYFTMDDQIRKLFNEKSKLFGVDYRQIELPPLEKD